MKRLFACMVVLVSVVISFTALADGNYPNPVTGKVISSRAGVRAEMDSDLEPFRFVKNGEEEKILGQIGEWFIVSDGYMAQKYVVLKPTKITTCDMVDVYAEYGSDKCVGTTPSNREYTIIAVHDDYYCINFNGGSGVVLKGAAIYTDVQDNQNSNQNPDQVTDSSEIGKVSEEANVRSGPGSQYDSLGKLKKGVSVQLVGQEGNWYIIKYKDGLGYVSARYIQR
jgi:hypothetical protein